MATAILTVHALGLLRHVDASRGGPTDPPGEYSVVLRLGRNPRGPHQWKRSAAVTRDGKLDPRDSIAYKAAWPAREPAADRHGAGPIDTIDFIASLNDRAAGC